LSPERNVRETPNFGCIVRWVHTINGGSCPLPVLYAFHASASDYSWWPIIDNFHYCHSKSHVIWYLKQYIIAIILNYCQGLHTKS